MALQGLPELFSRQGKAGEFGGRRWRKLKGIALVRTVDGEEFWAEIHYYECHGIGRRQTKVVREIK